MTSQLSPGVLATVFGINPKGIAVTVTGPGTVVPTSDEVSPSPFAVNLDLSSPGIPQNFSYPGVWVFVSGSKVISPANPANHGDTLWTLATGLGALTPPIATGAPVPPPPPSYTTVVPPVLTAGSTTAHHPVAISTTTFTSPAASLPAGRCDITPQPSNGGGAPCPSSDGAVDKTFVSGNPGANTLDPGLASITYGVRGLAPWEGARDSIANRCSIRYIGEISKLYCCRQSVLLNPRAPSQRSSQTCESELDATPALTSIHAVSMPYHRGPDKLFDLTEYRRRCRSRCRPIFYRFAT